MSPTPTDASFMKSSYPHMRLAELYGIDYGDVLILGEAIRAPLLDRRPCASEAEARVLAILGWTVTTRLLHALREVWELYR